MFKKIICAVIGAVILLGTTGCFGSSSDTPYTISRKMMRNIQKYLKNGNAEEFCALFAPNSEVTVQEVNDLFEYIGEIESIKRGGISSGGATSINGKYTDYSYGGRLTAVAKSGIEYKVDFSATAVNDEKPERIGLGKLCFIKSSDSTDVYGIGECYNEIGEALDMKGNVVERTRRKDRAKSSH